VFSLGQIVVCAVGGIVLSAIALFIYRRLAEPREGSMVDSSLWPLPLVVGVSILMWRAAGNTPVLNDDPIAFVSPNDVLCPVITYASLGVYAGFRNVPDSSGWKRIRAVLTIVSLVVNVVTI
jgi:hypothetical protein